MIHTEIILQRNRSKSLCSRFNLHIFFSFNRLVQTIRITAPLHDTTGLLIHNLHLIIDHHIFYILLEQSVSFQQLTYSMHTLRFHGVILNHFVFTLQLLVFILHRLFDFGDFFTDIRKNKELRILAGSSNRIVSLIRQIDRVLLLINHKIQRICNFRHPPVIFLHVFVFRLDQYCLIPLLTQKLNQRFIFR